MCHQFMVFLLFTLNLQKYCASHVFSLKLLTNLEVLHLNANLDSNLFSTYSCFLPLWLSVHFGSLLNWASFA